MRTHWLQLIYLAVLLAFAGTVHGQMANSADKVELTAQWSADEAGAGDTRVLAVILDIKETYHINPDKDQLAPANDFLPIATRLRVINPPAGIEIGPVQYPRPHEITVGYIGEPTKILAMEGRNVLYVPVRVGQDVLAGQMQLQLELRIQACDHSVCYMPGKKRLTAVLNIVDHVVASDGLDAALFEGFKQVPVDTPPKGIDQLIEQPQEDRLDLNVFGWEFSVKTSGFAMLAILLLAGVGGMLLNFTPCVLPVIPLKIMGLSRAAGNRGRCLELGAAMSLGVVAFWIVLAAVVISVSEITMTSQLFSYPAFSIGVGVLIAVMAVGMCGLFAVKLPQFVYRLNPGHDTLIGSFGFGVMTAVLSTPCTAPLMGSASAWAITQPPGMTLSVFASIGCGMALPYLVLSAFPQWAQRMPRTGPASELIKQVMGLLILAAAAFFIGIGICILLKPVDSPTSLLYWWPVVGLCAVAGGWLIYRTVVISGRGVVRHIFIVVGLLMIVSSLYAGVRLTEPSEINWVYYSPQKFEEARAGNKVIVLEFTAEWCLNCKALEKTVLSRRSVINALNQDQVAAIKVDLTDEKDKASRLKLAEVGMLAPPVLVIYARDGSELLKAESYTSGQIVKAVKRGLSVTAGAR